MHPKEIEAQLKRTGKKNRTARKDKISHGRHEYGVKPTTSQSDPQVENGPFLTESGFLHCRKRAFAPHFFQLIASLIPLQNTHSHADTPIPGLCYTAVSYTSADAGLTITSGAFRRKSACALFPAPPASGVYRTMAAARGIDVVLPTTATPAVASATFG